MVIQAASLTSVLRPGTFLMWAALARKSVRTCHRSGCSTRASNKRRWPPSPHAYSRSASARPAKPQGLPSWSRRSGIPARPSRGQRYARRQQPSPCAHRGRATRLCMTSIAFSLGCRQRGGPHQEWNSKKPDFEHGCSLAPLGVIEAPRIELNDGALAHHS